MPEVSGVSENQEALPVVKVWQSVSTRTADSAWTHCRLGKASLRTPSHVFGACVAVSVRAAREVVCETNVSCLGLN